MILCDVNVLLYAFKEGSERHQDYQSWLQSVIDSDEAFGVADLVLSGFVRLVTHPRVFDIPSSTAEAFDFVDALRRAPNSVAVVPGPRHWDIFRRLCVESGARGTVVPDAYLAALAIESGCEWITTDRGFARFPGLRWRPPLNPSIGR